MGTWCLRGARQPVKNKEMTWQMTVDTRHLRGAQQQGREQGHDLEHDESCLVPTGDQAAVQLSNANSWDYDNVFPGE